LRAAKSCPVAQLWLLARLEEAQHGSLPVAKKSPDLIALVSMLCRCSWRPLWWLMDSSVVNTSRCYKKSRLRKDL
jgi:hypothetical protein